MKEIIKKIEELESRKILNVKLILIILVIMLIVLSMLVVILVLGSGKEIKHSEKEIHSGQAIRDYSSCKEDCVESETEWSYNSCMKKCHNSFYKKCNPIDWAYMGKCT